MTNLTLNELSHISDGYSEEQFQKNHTVTLRAGEAKTVSGQSKLIAYHTETRTIKLVLETLSDSNKGIKSLDIQRFDINVVGEELIFTSSEENRPLRAELIFIPKRGVLRFSLHFNYDRGNVVQLLQSIEFIDSFNNAKKLRILDVNDGSYNIFDIPPETQFQVDQTKFAIVKALAAIQNYTGIEFYMPERLSKEELLRILVIEKMIETKLMLARPIGVTLRKQEALRLIEMYMNHKMHKDSTIKEGYHDRILGKDIVIRDLTLYLSTVRPNEKLTDLYKRITEDTNDVAQIGLIDSTEYLLNYIRTSKEFPDNELANAIEQASEETKLNFKLY